MQSHICNASFSQIDITPDFPTALVGCYRPDPRAQGTAHRLCAQTLLFQWQNQTHCLIAIDNLGLTTTLANEIRDRAATLLHTERENVMLNFSHTHSAPEPTPYALNGERYFTFLRARIEACVREALNHFAPCKIGWALTECGIGENRRDGGSVTDPRLGGLLITDARDGRPMALLLRVAAHANVLMQQSFKLSSDYFGPARDALAPFFGCPVMILQGAAGNLKPLGVKKVGGGDLQDLARISNMLIGAAKRLRFTLQEVIDLQMREKPIPFVSDVPDPQEAERIAATAPGPLSQAWLDACASLREAGVKTQSIPAKIAFLKVNQGCICGVAEEIFCELALDAQRRTGNPLLFLNGYTNGCGGYLPSRNEWAKGGYEVLESNFIYHKYHGHVMPYRAETADRIVDVVADAWAEMTGEAQGEVRR